jgi:hypothetical protein
MCFPCYVGPCHHGLARLLVTDGGDGLQTWRTAANILNKQSRSVDKGWFYSLVLGKGMITLQRKMPSCYLTLRRKAVNFLTE